MNRKEHPVSKLEKHSRSQNSDQMCMSQGNAAIPLKIRQQIQLMLLLRHNKIGCLLTSLQDEYKVCFGSDICPEQFGHKSWLEMCKAMPDEVRIQTTKRFIMVEGMRVTHSVALGYLKKIFSSPPSSEISSATNETHGSASAYTQNYVLGAAASDFGDGLTGVKSPPGDFEMKNKVPPKLGPGQPGMASTNYMRDADSIRSVNEIRQMIANGGLPLHIKAECTAIHVGTHKMIGEDALVADICGSGIMFNMTHLNKSSGPASLFIPHNSILTVTCHAEMGSSLFLIFRIGSKVASTFREALGMKVENRKLGWFDPHQGIAPERNVLFMMKSLTSDQFQKVKAIYGRNLQVLGESDAMCLLQHLHSL